MANHALASLYMDHTLISFRTLGKHVVAEQKFVVHFFLMEQYFSALPSVEKTKTIFHLLFTDYGKLVKSPKLLLRKVRDWG